MKDKRELLPFQVEEMQKLKDLHKEIGDHLVNMPTEDYFTTTGKLLRNAHIEMSGLIEYKRFALTN